MIQSSFYNLILVQFREIYRSPGHLFWAFAFPVAMAWVLGIAFTGEGELVHKVVLVKKSNPATARLLYRMRHAESRPAQTHRNYDFASDGRKFRVLYRTRREAHMLLKRGRISLFLEARGSKVLYHFDRKNPDGRLTYFLLKDFLKAKPKPAGDAGHEVRNLTAPGSRYIDFLIPGLIALGIMNGSLWGVGWGLIELRTRRLLRRLAASPMSKVEFLLAIFITRIVVGALETLLLLVFSIWFFDIQVQGGYGPLVLMYICGSWCFTGLAILASSRTDNPRFGNGVINAMTMPMLVFSGIFFSYHNFPDWLVPLVKYLPLTVLADGIRAIFVEGAAWAVLFPGGLILAVTGAVFFGFGLRIYKWH